MMNLSTTENKRNSRDNTNFSQHTPYFFKLNFLLLCLCLSLFLVGCSDNSSENETAPVTEILELNADNIDEFTLTFANTYLNTVDTLLTEFKKYKKANDPYGFARYRNFHWTPKYIEKKDYYLATIEKNRDFLETSKVKPLFDKFENIIYYGIDLKRSLLEKDRKLLDETVAALKDQEAVVNAVIMSAGLDTKFKQFRKGGNLSKPSAPLNIISN